MNTEDRTLVILAPSVLDRDLCDAICRAFEVVGLAIAGRRLVRLDPSTWAALDHAGMATTAPLEHRRDEWSATAGQALALIVGGPGAVEGSLAVQALVRQRWERREQGRLMWAAASADAADHQINVLFDSGLGESRPDQCAVLLHDNDTMTVDELAAAITAAIPQCPDDRSALLAHWVKCHAAVEVAAGALGEAAATASRLNDEGCSVSLRWPDWLGRDDRVSG